MPKKARSRRLPKSGGQAFAAGVFPGSAPAGGGDEQLAKDVAQTVFIALARNANRLYRREVITVLALYDYALYRSQTPSAGDLRRRTREQAAAAMQELYSQPSGEADWSDVGPVLDEAIQARLEPDG